MNDWKSREGAGGGLHTAWHVMASWHVIISRMEAVKLSLTVQYMVCCLSGFSLFPWLVCSKALTSTGQVRVQVHARTTTAVPWAPTPFLTLLLFDRERKKKKVLPSACTDCTVSATEGSEVAGIVKYCTNYCIT